MLVRACNNGGTCLAMDALRLLIGAAVYIALLSRALAIKVQGCVLCVSPLATASLAGSRGGLWRVAPAPQPPVTHVAPAPAPRQATPPLE